LNELWPFWMSWHTVGTQKKKGSRLVALTIDFIGGGD
jgi:hypothetical protein